MRTTIIITLAVVALACGRIAQAADVTIDPPSTPLSVTAAELRLTVSTDRSSVTIPGTFELTFLVTNTGAVAAQQVSLDYTLPAKFRFRDPAAAATLKTIGTLPTGESFTKTLTIEVPAAVVSDRYMNEAVVTATNADSVQADAGINIVAGQILGASDQLAVTGGFPWLSVFFGLVLLTLGFRILRPQRQS